MLHAAEKLQTGNCDVTVLVVTRDADLYARIREAVSVWKWTVHVTAEAIPGISYFREPAAIRMIIYDGDSIEGDWKDAFTSIRQMDRQSCVLLASRVSDGCLRDEVIRCGGYDVIAKSNGPEQMARALNFACFRKRTSCQR